MRSIDERLAAADPATAGYAHPGLDAVVARVVATPGPRRDAVWRGFRRKVLTAAAATSLLTGAGIVGLSTAGVSLPVLALASASPANGSAAQVYGTASRAPTMFMPVIRNWQFVTTGLSDVPGSAGVYQVAPASDPVGSLARAASVLGVDLGAAATFDNGATYLASGPLYSGSLAPFGGYSSWTISRNDAPPVVSTSDAAATDAYNATAVAWTRELTSLDVGTPSATSIGLQGMADPGPVQVSVPLLVEGHATDFAFDFVFAGDGNLVAANGVDVTLTSKGDYPLLSPAAAASQIPTQLFLHPFAGGWVAVGGAGVAASGSASGSPGEVTPPTPDSSTSPASPPVTAPVPGTTSSVPEATTTVPPTVVDLTGVATSYSVYAMTDGTLLLLPVYVYTGAVEGEGASQSFRVVPIDPSLIDLSFAVTPQVY
ncbi:MAG: hypothetical protein KGJ36_08040 [Acidobacteriota bacterium]|nr:hypothetical protein [Acidobacteriota bacterium]